MKNEDFDQLMRLCIFLVYGGLATLLVSFVLLWIGRNKTSLSQIDTMIQQSQTNGTDDVSQSS